MTAGILIAILGPAVAGSVALAVPDSPAWAYGRRWIAAIGFELGLGAAIIDLVRAVRTGPFSAAGFEVDAWRATLAVGMLAVSAAVLGKVEHGRFATAAFLGSTAAAVASVFARDTFTFAAFLFATTVGFGVVAASDGARAGLGALSRYLAADAAAVAGLVLIATDGMRLPPGARGVGAGLLAGAVAVRCGLFPGTRWFESLTQERGRAAALALGAMRAQGLMMAAWLGVGRGNAAAALFVGGAVLAVHGARRAARESSAGAAQVALGGLVLVALGRGAATTVHGAAMLVAGVLLGTALLMLERSRDVGSPTVGAAPLGATLPGAFLIAAALFERGLTDRPSLVVAAAVAAAVAWLGIAGVQGFAAPGAHEVHPGWAALPLAGVATLVAIPGTVLSAYGSDVAQALGSPRTLGPLPGTTPDELGITFAIAGVLGVVLSIGSGRLLVRAHAPEGLRWDDGPAVSVRSLAPALLAGAASFGWLLAFLWVGIRRGFL